MAEAGVLGDAWRVEPIDQEIIDTASIGCPWGPRSRTGLTVVLLGDDLPAAASAGLVAFAEAGGFPVWGAQLTSRTAFHSQHPCWAGVLKPDFAEIRQHLQSVQAIVLVRGRAFVAYPYREAEPAPEGVAVTHIADSPNGRAG